MWNDGSRKPLRKTNDRWDDDPNYINCAYAMYAYAQKISKPATISKIDPEWQSILKNPLNETLPK